MIQCLDHAVAAGTSKVLPVNNTTPGWSRVFTRGQEVSEADGYRSSRHHGDVWVFSVLQHVITGKADRGGCERLKSV